MDNILNNAEEIEIVGIIRPNPEAVANQMLSQEVTSNLAELFKIFGMLSKKHQYDVLAIMRTLFNIS